MPIDLDRRSRGGSDVRPISPSQFFTEDFVELARRNSHLVVAGIRFLKPPPLALTVDAVSWTITADGDELRVDEGIAKGALEVPLTAKLFSEFAQNQISLNGLIVARLLRPEATKMREVSIWDALWHALVDGWPVVDPALAFIDRHGAPLDLATVFTLEDGPADIAHFLREAGYLHLRGWLDPSDMAAIIADMDRALPSYVEGDGKSWWATTADGTRTCVRLQEFVEHSPTTARILSSAKWDHLRRTLAGDDELVRAPVEGRIIEALFKPVGVVSGPSDVTFHRDCHLGGHVYNCSGTTIGIALTATSADNGQLRVIAGSHRVAVPVEVAKTDPYLPLIGVPTEPGDLTVHLSCTLHEATPPVTHERRVMYTNFGLPPQEDAVVVTNALSELREQVTNLLREEQSADDNKAI
jgi:ectoine hydroxylase-related dioxygenase (phytanoyl-CoA dioxygenase family)